MSRTLENGKRTRWQSKGFATAAAAQHALDAMLANDVAIAKRSPASLRSIISAYLERTDRDYSPTTLQRYRGLTKLLDGIGDLQVERLGSFQVERFYAGLRKCGLRGQPLSQMTILHVHALLRSSCRWAKRRRLISRHPFEPDGVAAPRPGRTEAAALTVAEGRRFIAHLDRTQFRNALLFALATGMRRGEVVGLKLAAIDFARHVAIVRESRYEIVGRRDQKPTKSGRVREVALSKLALSALKAERDRTESLRTAAHDAWTESGFVFVDELGLPLAPSALSKAFNNVAKHAGLPKRYTLHSLRHTAATWMLAGGMELPAVQHVLGHTQASTTSDVYAHVMEERARAAVDKIAEHLGPD